MIAAIRVRGRTGIKKDIADTLDMLKLTRINHAVLIEENPSYQGMLQKAKDYITWGEIDSETVAKIISKRGKLAGNIKVTEDYLKENTDYSSVEELSKAVVDSGAKLEDSGIKPVFRLHPPRKGYEDIKKTFVESGSLGYRGDKIGDLIKKMI
ncbi:MAG: 50S ribosomal protein L30 [Methanobacterium sp.]|uniref:50S ribosomal protein L30 n=1 Tax=Methanobacterium sp. TaxID=2164 RepID=UPI003D65ED15|nr:50S ribosomal protein L30 [Methanobacterium sp.]